MRFFANKRRLVLRYYLMQRGTAYGVVACNLLAYLGFSSVINPVNESDIAHSPHSPIFAGVLRFGVDSREGSALSLTNDLPAVGKFSGSFPRLV